MLDKFVSKTENQTVNKVTKMLERFKERMTTDNLRLGERYIKGEIRLIVHIRLSEENYVAVLQRCPDATRHAETADALFEPTQEKATGNLKGDTPDIKERDEQSVVLVGNVQIVDSPEKLVSTLVRVGSVNGIYSTLSHALYSSMTLGLVLRGALPNRESDLLPLSLRESETTLGASDFNQLPSEMFKSASEVMNNVSGNESDFSRRRLDVSHAIDCLSRLRIELGFDSIRFAVKETLPNDFKLTDVLFGPFNFYADERESFVGCHGSSP